MCRSQKGRVAFQIKLALNTVHFHALWRCARINELELNQSDRANTLDFYLCALCTSTVLRMLMAAESTYYESLASVRYVEEAKKRNRTRRLQEAKMPYLLYSEMGDNIWAET